MIRITKTETSGFQAATRGMRNPLNSWEKGDSNYCMLKEESDDCINCPFSSPFDEYCVGSADRELMNKLSKAGSDHAKFRRFMIVTADIIAPLYWWKEFDTYKVGTVANSCSTMHKIHAKEFTPHDFSLEHLNATGRELLRQICCELNFNRNIFIMSGDKNAWWQMIQLLPSSYNQLRTVQLNYEVLANMYRARKNHKLDEWKEFCEWVKQLPYSEIITGEVANGID